MAKKARHKPSPYAPPEPKSHDGTAVTQAGGRILPAISKGVFWFAHKGPIVVLYGIGLYFNTRVLQNFKLDTTPITNAAFAALGALAGLSFSAASVIDDRPEERRLFTRVGERYLYAAFIMLIASLLKYAYLDLIKIPVVLGTKPLGYAVEGLALFFVPGLFFRSLILAHDGTAILNRLYLTRYYREGSEPLLWSSRPKPPTS